MTRVNEQELPEEDSGDDSVIGYALFWSLGAIALLGAVIVGVVVWLNRAPPTVVTQQSDFVKPTVRELPTLTVPGTRRRQTSGLKTA